MQEILEIIRNCEGKKSFVSQELGIPLDQLEQLCQESSEIKEEFDSISQFKTQLLTDLLDLRVQYGVALGEHWAIDQATKSTEDMNITINNIQYNTEEIMKEKGIPIPEIDTADLDE